MKHWVVRMGAEWRALEWTGRAHLKVEADGGTIEVQGEDIHMSTLDSKDPSDFIPGYAFTQVNEVVTEIPVTPVQLESEEI